MRTSSPSELWSTIAGEAAGESPLWAESLLPTGERELGPVFSPLGRDLYALGIETIYEAYLVHYGRSRLFAPPCADTALLLGDYLYAHGLVRVAELGVVEAIADLAELVSLAAQIRAQGEGDDGPAWAATAALLGRGELEPARLALRRDGDPAPLRELAEAAVGAAALEQALEAHRLRLLR